MKWLQSQWTLSGIGLLLYCLTTVLCWHAPRPVSPPLSKSKTATAAGPSWTFQNPELDQLVSELKHEKETLAAKEKQLNDFEARLKAERLELNQLTHAVQMLQTDFDRSLVQIDEQETGNLKKLAKLYAGMAPENAVPILRQMDETTLVKVLASMKDAERGAIFEALGKGGEADTKLAATLSERLRLAVTKSPTPQGAGR